MEKVTKDLKTASTRKSVYKCWRTLHLKKIVKMAPTQCTAQHLSRFSWNSLDPPIRNPILSMDRSKRIRKMMRDWQGNAMSNRKKEVFFKELSFIWRDKSQMDYRQLLPNVEIAATPFGGSPFPQNPCQDANKQKSTTEIRLWPKCCHSKKIFSSV